MYEIGKTNVSRLRWERGEGVSLNPELNFTAGALEQQWQGLDDFSRKQYSTASMDFGRMLHLTKRLPANKVTRNPDFIGRVVLVTGGASG